MKKAWNLENLPQLDADLLSVLVDMCKTTLEEVARAALNMSKMARWLRIESVCFNALGYCISEFLRALNFPFTPEMSESFSTYFKKYGEFMKIIAKKVRKISVRLKNSMNCARFYINNFFYALSKME